MNHLNIKKISISGLLIAITVSLSTFSIPVFGARCYPIQHFVNIISGVLLGPIYSVCIAFCTSFLRNILGTGSLLAFPGSMIGALFCGLIYRYTKRISFACMGELFGTGIIGAMLCYPIVTYVLGKNAAIFTFVIPFISSSCSGTVFAILLLSILSQTKALCRLQNIISQ